MTAVIVGAGGSLAGAALQHGRVHVFCRTGTRALHMWLLAQQLNGDSFENLQATARRFHVTMPVFQ